MVLVNRSTRFSYFLANTLLRTRLLTSVVFENNRGESKTLQNTGLCLEAFSSKRCKSKAGGNTEAGEEFQTLPVGR
ncbi:hypothetical protein E2C01_087400 [Portunus trituberculatus]|uniref:Uncharacterized protein n=1 Tax=Portunus trituberculatus TaxID=210409 RepID=A0A5B7JH68_PORTR|nr:hypothetical protein [Portunus trituberculatus]